MKIIDRQNLWNAGYVELWDFSRANMSEYDRICAISHVASICYGKTIEYSKELYQRLMTEHNGLPTSTLEFIRGSFDTSISSSLRNNPGLPYDSAPNNLVAAFRIKVPAFVAQQLTRHRSFSWQGLSRRYTTNSKSPFEFWMPEVDPFTNHKIEIHNNHSVKLYEDLLKTVKPEVARSVIPQSEYKTYWMLGDYSAFENLFDVRLCHKAQPETSDVVQSMLSLLIKSGSEIASKYIAKRSIENENSSNTD